ncbi:FG-GAP repeat protein [Reinekea thalattae]|nr:FG-GAP repeat protein [Reinekea thalattae]
MLVSSCQRMPNVAAELTLSVKPVKVFEFTWSDVEGATYYKLLEKLDSQSSYVTISENIEPNTNLYTTVRALYERTNASYVLQSCNQNGCVDSPEVTVNKTINQAIGHLKSNTPNMTDMFGSDINLSADGSTLAVGVPNENISYDNNSSSKNEYINTGAVYIYTLSENNWVQQAHIKADNIKEYNRFGTSVSLSKDGNILAVGALGADRAASSANDRDPKNAGAAYIYVRDQETNQWRLRDFIQASNAEEGDLFGHSVRLSDDGNTLAVAAIGEDGDQSSAHQTPDTQNKRQGAGAVYLYKYNGASWHEEAYIKSIILVARSDNRFGDKISLSGDGNSLAVSSYTQNRGVRGRVYLYAKENGQWQAQQFVEATNPDNYDDFAKGFSLNKAGNVLAVGATSIDDRLVRDPGVVFIFNLDSNDQWQPTAFITAQNKNKYDYFGYRVDLDSSGTLLVVSATGEDSNGIGLTGDPNNNEQRDSGAAYVFQLTNDGTWQQTGYLKSTNPTRSKYFGGNVQISDDKTIAISTTYEDTNASGINGQYTDEPIASSGAVYLY